MAKGKGSTKGARAGRSRRGKGEDFTGRADNVVEMRKSGDLGLGEPVILDDGDFDLHLRSLKSAIDRQKTAKNLYDGVCKAAKKVSEDLLVAIKRAVKFEGMNAEDIKKQMEIDGYVLRRAGSSVQLTIHDTLLGDVNEAAYKRGFDAGQNGQTLANPYPKLSDLAEQYATGWRNGMASNVKGGAAALKREEAEGDDDDSAIPPAPAPERREAELVN